MKIVVALRTRDEEQRIAAFCESYKDADCIIVSDGGSEDRTVEIASSFPNVILQPFKERTELKNGLWRNNDSAHANFVFQAAEAEGADWIIYDDCDCRPNKLVKERYRSILESTQSNVVNITRFYFWGKDKHFPQFAQPGGNGQYEPSLWAWRTNLNLRTVNDPPAYTFTSKGKDIRDLRNFDGINVLDLYPPYALLHYYMDEERLQRKMKNYVESGLIPGFDDPRKKHILQDVVEDWLHE